MGFTHQKIIELAGPAPLLNYQRCQCAYSLGNEATHQDVDWYHDCSVQAAYRTVVTQ